ncbi:MAG: hypothetical protein ACE5JL_03295, partial [Dehalococcoidia bacterium]
VHKVRRRGQQFLEGPPQHTVDVIVLPAGEDPDDVIRRNQDDWVSLTEKAQPLIDYLIETKVSGRNLDPPGARAEVLEEFAPLLVTTDFSEQDRYVQKLSEVLRVREDSIKQALRAAQRRSSRSSSRFKQHQEVLEESDIIQGTDALEERLLTLILQYPYLKRLVSSLEPTTFRQIENRQIFLSYMSSEGPDELRQSLPEPLLDHLEAMSLQEVPPTAEDQSKRELTQCVRRLEERRLKDLKMQEEYFLSQEETEAEEVTAIQRKGLEVNVQLKTVQREQKLSSRSEAGNR